MSLTRSILSTFGLMNKKPPVMKRKLYRISIDPKIGQSKWKLKRAIRGILGNNGKYIVSNFLGYSFPIPPKKNKEIISLFLQYSFSSPSFVVERDDFKKVIKKYQRGSSPVYVHFHEVPMSKLLDYFQKSWYLSDKLEDFQLKNGSNCPNCTESLHVEMNGGEACCEECSFPVFPVTQKEVVKAADEYEKRVNKAA